MNWITLLGFAAAICTTVSFLPQAIKTIKTKNTKSLSLVMYSSILTIGIFLWLVYGIFLKDLPIILANGITLPFTATILVLKMMYQ